MPRLLSAIAALSVLMMAFSGARAATPTAVLSTPSGQLRGAILQGARTFKGIPYALPPIGVLRWRPPQPVAAWAGVRDATAYGGDCMQHRFALDSTPSNQPMSEDCLYLNVWAPAQQPAKPAPVMVWIHGGGLTIGSGASPVFDGSGFARKGVVLVTLNYRLGRFGFFAHPALIAEHPQEPAGDYGLMDQIAALKWVRRNIGAFGGDPDNVTVFGQSSGGASILHLMISPAAQGLFAKAIVQSGGGREHWARLDRDVVDTTGVKTGGLEAGERFAASVGIRGSGSDAATALRALAADKVLGDVSFLHAESADYSGPMVDGRIIPSDVDAGFSGGHETRVPLLIGANDDELGALPEGMANAISRAIETAFGPQAPGLSAYYGPGKSRPPDLISDIAFVEPARFIAERHAANHAAVWLYRFSYVASQKRKLGVGAEHATEIPFVFGTLTGAGLTPSPADERASEAIQGYWISFARESDPNRPGLPRWPRYGTAGSKLMLFANGGPSAEIDPTGPRLDYIDQNYAPNER